MARQVRWSPRAAADLAEICGHIAADSHRYASLFARNVLSRVEVIARFPELGRVVPEYNDEHIRETFHQRYRIVYRLRPEAVEIVRIIHGRRRLT